MIELGREVQDRITGYSGIAIAKTTYLQGCNRILVQPKISNGKVTIPDAQSFDEPDLEVVGDGVLPKLEPKPKKNGGPRPTTSRARMPERRTA